MSGSVCGGPPFFDFAAGFFPILDTPGCPVITLGPCQYFACSTQQGVGAGIIRISGGNIPPGATAMQDPSNFNTYLYTPPIGGLVFQAGQTLTMEASGGVVPAFTASAVAPGLTSLIAPTAASGAPYNIPTNADLVVAWIPASAPAGVQMLFSGGASTVNSQYFQCTWDASLGKAVVPQAMLAGLAGQTNGYLFFGLNTTNNVDPGGYAVAVTATQYVGASVNFR